MVSIDLQKVFDTTDHQILLKKVKYLGFSKNTIAWFKSYHREQEFKISINTSYFSPSNLLYSVLQGFILGSRLLLLNIHFGQDKTKPILFGNLSEEKKLA